MKKTAIAIAVALAGFATVAQAAPKDNTWYTGAKLGWSQYHDTGFINNSSCVSLSLTPPMRRTSCVSARFLTRTCTKVMVNYAFVSLSIKTSAR